MGRSYVIDGLGAKPDRRTQTAAFLRCFSLAAIAWQGFADNDVKPWSIFADSLVAAANNIVKDSEADFGESIQPPAGAKRQLAEAVVRGIEGLWDVGKEMHVVEFGYGFSCAIYDAVIPEAYSAAITFGSGFELDSQTRRWAENGAAILQQCRGIKKSQFLQKPVERLGLPCPGGAAVQGTAQAHHGAVLNYIVYYYPKDPARGFEPSRYLKTFEAGLSILKTSPTSRFLKLSGDSPWPVDLTKLAGCVAMQCNIRGKGQVVTAYTFKAVMVIPLYSHGQLYRGSTALRGFYKAPQSSAVGLFGPFGHFAMDHLHINTDTGSSSEHAAKPLALLIVVAVPTGAAREVPLYMCNSCY